ncbi:lipid A deacylase LpxR family protein [Dokdonia sp. Hel_I_53]|uniref:lipid A deacylase LpxR family protein n=1 Tax=Dokdonia sp. Hel_I_53 TaxID=1566287 RepID=UPI00119C6A59|nr:lipid A deacylase LpxR family protein [Dokdonia sp. Hel_I_53]TVZ52150.1 hypothetical protein OD90_1315 [Dokdonia sp. Hel_I_53]
MKKYLFIVMMFLFAFAKAQKNKLTNSEALQGYYFQHDNDFLFAIDRYYTAGSFIGYRKQLDGDFIFKGSELYPVQFDLTIGQETYTPRELFDTNFDRLERPYAGYLFLKSAISRASKSELFSLALELGLAGEQSKARVFQISYHKLIGEFIPVWSGQIANSSHLNTYGFYVKDLTVPNSNLLKNFSLASTLALGTRRIFVRQEALVFIGNRERIGCTSAFNRLGSNREFYGFGGVGIEYVALNALIEGHPFNDSSPFTLPVESRVLSFKLGAVYRGVHNLYELIYNFRTKETAREGRSQFIAFSFGRLF